WYATLLVAGDLPACLPPRAHSLGGFLGFFQPPTLLLADRDAQGITVAAWAKPWCDGASVGLWLRADLRTGLRAQSRRAALRWVLVALRVFLSRWPVLIVVTRQAAQRRLYAKWGVAVFAPEPVPGLLSGPAWFGWLTTEGLAAAFPPAAPPAESAWPADSACLDCGSPESGHACPTVEVPA
ncbi:MAG: hypothetical protein AABY22_00010, partial [Nanoarchaeota archaeon]